MNPKQNKKKGRPKKTISSEEKISQAASNVKLLMKEKDTESESVVLEQNDSATTTGFALFFNSGVPFDTKPNPSSSYYQYIHPCNLHLKKYHYRFIIVKNGKTIMSEPYENIKECHKDVKALIEEAKEM